MKDVRRGFWTALSGLLLGTLLMAVAPVQAAVGVIETTAGEVLQGQLTEEFIILDNPLVGQLTLGAGQITRVTVNPGRVELAGGDVLSGTVKNELIHFTTEFAAVAIRTDKVKSLAVKDVAVPAGAPGGVEVRLRNGDRVLGALTFDKTIRPSVGILTDYAGTVNVDLAEIANIESSGEQYAVTLRDGSRLTGAITNVFFVLRTAYGELVLPRTAIAGFTFPKAEVKK
ncbi:MAG TPA: hypothetical protein GXX28_11685 [Firmicutes bacterium]|nr:hypothetical protein [Bacillota bacterium]